MNGENKIIFEKFVRVMRKRGSAGVTRLEEAVLRTGDGSDGGLIFRSEDADFIRGVAAECGVTTDKLFEVIVECGLENLPLIPTEEVNRSYRRMTRERNRLLGKEARA